MAQYTVYANYVIYFRSATDYNVAVLTAGGNQWLHSPSNAATTFGLTFPPPGGALGDKGMYSLGSGTGQWSVTPPGTAILHPGATGLLMNPLVDSILVPGQASPPVSAIPGPDMLLVWCGNIVRIGGTSGISPTVPAIPQRRFIGGVEIRPQGEGGSGLNSGNGCRDASRTIDGIGMAIRGANSTGIWNRLVAEFQAGFTSRNSRERLYIRWRTLPTSAIFRFWQSHGSISNAAGGGLRLTNTGTLQALNIDQFGNEVVVGTSAALLQNTWYLLDILLNYNPGPGTTGGYLKVFLNHAVLFNVFISDASTGLNQIQFHSSSDIGDTRAINDATIELDLDDWINSDVNTLDSLDFFVGSHVRKRYITGFGPLQGTWAGQANSLNQGHNPDQQVGSQLISSTNGAVLDGVTDYVDDSQDSIGQVLGPVAAIIEVQSTNSGATDGTLGYSAAGAAPVMTTIDQTGAMAFQKVAYRPSVPTTPLSITPLRILHNKSADANTDTINDMMVITEEIGTWGLEDDPGTIPTPRISLLHNAYYPNSIWGYVGPVPDGPVSSVGGTYVGNGTTTTVNLPAHCHFLMVRPLTGANGGWRWFGSSLGGHAGISVTVIPHGPARVFVDTAGQSKFIVVGTDTQVNAAGVTYQYVAFCDPGMRYNLCGAYAHNNAIASKVNALVDSHFLPVGGFIQLETLNIVSGTGGLSYKGPGNGANDGTLLGAGVSTLANWGSFQLGSITTRADTHQGGPAQANYSLWRTVDGSGYVMVQILSYVGDGGASKVINLTPASGRFPLMALVVPHNNTQSFYRDPSHAGLNSSNAAFDATSATAIIGGAVDQITVGSTINVNGVVYDVFVIPGDSAGWNNGTFTSPNYAAGGLIAGVGGSQWPSPVSSPATGPVVQGDGGLTLGGDPSLGLLRDISGIYTLIPGQYHDALIDRQPGVSAQNRKIPDPYIKTGYIGG